MPVYNNLLPNIAYTFTDATTQQQQTILVKDITRNYRLTQSILANAAALLPYTIQDGETPWIISQNQYNTPYYDWLILITNNIQNYLSDWPLTQLQLNNYINSNYSNPNGIAYYVSPSGFVVDSTYPGATGVSYIDYEIQVNEAKRNIYIIDPQYITTILKLIQNS